MSLSKNNSVSSKLHPHAYIWEQALRPQGFISWGNTTGRDDKRHQCVLPQSKEAESSGCQQQGVHVPKWTVEKSASTLFFFFLYIYKCICSRYLSCPVPQSYFIIRCKNDITYSSEHIPHSSREFKMKQSTHCNLVPHFLQCKTKHCWSAWAALGTISALQRATFKFLFCSRCIHQHC